MKKLALALLACMTTLPASAQTFLRADGQRIVDESGNPVLLRGMGLGGWMLEGKLKFKVDMDEGLENAVKSVRKLYTGENTGKLMLKV